MGGSYRAIAERVGLSATHVRRLILQLESDHPARDAYSRPNERDASASHAEPAHITSSGLKVDCGLWLDHEFVRRETLFLAGKGLPPEGRVVCGVFCF
jgi:DNA-binding Lrp family transcriptional regulator